MRPSSPIVCRSEASISFHAKLNRSLGMRSFGLDCSGQSVLRKQTSETPHRFALHADIRAIGGGA